MPPSTQGPDDRRSYHHGNLRASLLEAAERLLRTEGAQGLSLRRVAREAGVSPAAPYRHFKDRHALLEAVAIAGFRALEERLDRIALDLPDDPLRQIVAACRAYVDEALAWPQRTHLMFGGILEPHQRSDELRRAVEESFGKLVSLVRRGEGRIFRPLPTRDLVLDLWAATHGFALLAAGEQLDAIHPGAAPGDLVERMVRQLVTGLGRPELVMDGDAPPEEPVTAP